MRSILLALCCLFWTVVVVRIVRYTDNHVGYNILWAIPLFLPMLAVGWPRRDTIGLGLIVAGLVSIAAILAIYYGNVLVPYEVWLKRGMPRRPF